ncbi:MAG: L-aspartate oxidase [Candidatus Cloacimonetes bacterium]|nr:L-aspartate oxidase [Candidatus Cloacimonadota bacterium]
MQSFDFLVIGSGIAGLTYALQVAKLGSVAVLTKGTMIECTTDYAQGGIAAVLAEADSFEKHVKDTYRAGHELGKLPVIRAIIEDGPEAIAYLLDIGTRFSLGNSSGDRALENLDLTREGGHSERRVAHAADSTGHQIMLALIAACNKNERITIFEHHIAIDLITQHHISNADGFVPGVSCWGAYALHTRTNEVFAFRARKTMLATGGGAQVYKNNTNPSICTGDGYAMARRAGARLVNMEFIQFHPTAFYSPEGKTFLISEALRGEGAALRLQSGETFMERHHPDGCLAPRDIVAGAIDFEMKKRGDRYVLLDATAIPAERLRERFPYIDGKCRKRDVDFTSQPIPVVPAAHYFCGGILATTDGLTDVHNLFVSGEVACSGLHGSNRLASNSLLSGLVMSLRAGRHPSNKDEVAFPDIPEWQDVGTFNENEWVVIGYNREILQSIMQGYVGITRSRRLLKYARARIHNIYQEIENFYQHNVVRHEVIESRNLAIVADIIVRSALTRRESRGLHQVVDHPGHDDENFQRDTII